MPVKRRPLVVANWKMNGTIEESSGLAREIASQVIADKGLVDCDVLICPPAYLLNVIWEAIQDSGIFLGGQDCHPAVHGAYTGDHSAEMLSDAGCQYVILGHSERRNGYGESDNLICKKVLAAFRALLVPIICVGETESERNSGRASNIVEKQLINSLPKTLKSSSAVIAYEPVWAIGSGRTPTLDEISHMHAFIRATIKQYFPSESENIRLLYGGSVNEINSATLRGIDDVDGVLVGGASLSAKSFLPITQVFASDKRRL